MRKDTKSSVKIAFVVLHYQTEAETVECVDSIFRNILIDDYHIVVVDNGSPNHSGKILKKRFSNEEKVSVILNEKNMGFAKGLNCGIDYLRKFFNCDFIVLLNNDTEIIGTNWPETIQKKYEEYQFAVLGPDIVDLSGEIHANPVEKQVNNIQQLKRIIKNRRRMYVLNYLYIYPIWFNIRRTLSKILRKEVSNSYCGRDVIGCQLQGSALILSNDFFNHMDGLYDGTFLYFEEGILCYFADKYNMKLLYTPDIKLLHKEGRATDYGAKNRRRKNLFFYKNSIDSCNALLKMMISDIKE